MKFEMTILDLIQRFNLSFSTELEVPTIDHIGSELQIGK